MGWYEVLMVVGAALFVVGVLSVAAVLVFVIPAPWFAKVFIGCVALLLILPVLASLDAILGR